jgi:hypothetical protein
LYNNIGVNPNTGLYSFKDKSGATTSRPITTNLTDRYILLNIDPEIFGGFQNTFTYKNFELDIFFQFVKQKQRNPIFLSTSIVPGVFSRFSPLNWPVEILEGRWQKDGDIATIQKFTRAVSGEPVEAYTAASNSQMGWVDGSFIRLKNASISYRLPEAWVKQMHLQNVRLYIQGQNILTFTPYKGPDPESGLMAFPPLRVLTGGIQVNL